eukprot:8916638-Pyramimonas_sp.AAC.1
MEAERAEAERQLAEERARAHEVELAERRRQLAAQERQLAEARDEQERQLAEDLARAERKEAEHAARAEAEARERREAWAKAEDGDWVLTEVLYSLVTVTVRKTWSVQPLNLDSDSLIDLLFSCVRLAVRVAPVHIYSAPADNLVVGGVLRRRTVQFEGAEQAQWLDQASGRLFVLTSLGQLVPVGCMAGDKAVRMRVMYPS